MAAQRSKSFPVALGGVLGALAIVIMAMGTIIPVATYTCPVLCVLLCNLVLKTCGVTLAWAWYGAVVLLSLLLAPDKEAAMVFVFLGYYPILRPWFNARKLPWLWKAVFFNCVITVLYWLLLTVIGLETEETGTLLAAILLILGNVVFFLMDRILGRRFIKTR